MSFNLQQTYSMAASPIPPISWEDYSSYIIQEYQDLLNTNSDEQTMQDFFEKNPSFIPGAYGLQDKTSHNPLY
ncbi:MAG: hypothetical protein J7647_26810 [Cyanobacteria bacterium SBLK]|nr:hypothetical protein [Cyanobacteria bacterium SBLK]